MEENMAGVETQPQQPKPEATAVKPLFDAGAFTITHITPNPEVGLVIQTRNSLRRKDIGAPLPLNADEKKVLRDRFNPKYNTNDSEIAFVKNKIAVKAKKENREPTSQDYTDTFIPKVSIVNITQEGNVISFDTRPVSFPLYSDIITHEIAERKDLVNMGASTGTAAAIVTADSKLILQYRGKGNRAYGNIPGASAAGKLDGEFDRSIKTRGTLEPITTEAVTKHLLKEATEELQVKPEDLKVRIVGISHDELKPYYEFVLLGQVNKTSHELAEKGLIPDDQDGHDFKERYFTIDYTPETIETLLTKVKCPLPSTHSAAYFMAGIELVEKLHGKNEAKKWGERVSQAIKENYKDIDRIVIANFGKYPVKSEGKPNRSKTGYDPLYLPEQQGLPPLLEELRRTGLVSEKMFTRLKQKYAA